MRVGRREGALLPACSQLQHAAGGGSHWWEQEAVPSPKAMGHVNLGETFQTTGQVNVRERQGRRRNLGERQRSCQDRGFP